jgi:hypothetical protein
MFSVSGSIGPCAANDVMEGKPFVLVCTADDEVRCTIVYTLRRLSYDHVCWIKGLEPSPILDFSRHWVVLIGPCFTFQEGKSIYAEFKSRDPRNKLIFVRDPFSSRFKSLTTAEEIPVEYPRISLPLKITQLVAMLTAV